MTSSTIATVVTLENAWTVSEAFLCEEPTKKDFKEIETVFNFMDEHKITSSYWTTPMEQETIDAISMETGIQF